MQRISSQLKMHLKTQLAVIENNSNASLGSKNCFSHSAKCANIYIILVTSKIVFPCLQNVDKAINYFKKPSRAIPSTLAPMLCTIVLVYIFFHHLAEHITINTIAHKHNH